MMKYTGPTKHFRSENKEGHADKHRWSTFENGMVVPKELEEQVKKVCPDSVDETSPASKVKDDSVSDNQKLSRAKELKDLKVSELKKMAKQLEIPKYYSMREDELINAIMKVEAE